MDSKTITDFILDHKRDKRAEFMITLFEKCNLSCAFCWQDHDDVSGMTTVRDKVSVLVNAAEDSPRQVMLYNLMGGELFADDIFDATMYSDYMYLITETNRQVNAMGKTCEFTCCTNLIFENVSYVQQLLDELTDLGITIKFTTSYDFTGRFNAHTKRIFMRNLELFSSDIVNISVVLTAPNIVGMMKNTDLEFKQLYNAGYKIYMDHYSPEHNAKVMTPSDKQLYDVFCFLIDHYPDTFPVNDWLVNHTNQLSCNSCTMVLPSGQVKACSGVPDTHTVTFFKNPAQLDTSSMEMSFLQQMGCTSCEYFGRCSLGCFMLHYFKARDELDECVYKMVFDKIVNDHHTKPV